MPRVVVAGHVNWDVTLEVDRIPLADEEASIDGQHRGGGGSAANVAVALAALDVETRLVGSVGDDEPGRSVRRELAERGVDIEPLAVRPGDTTVKYLLVSPDGSVAMLGNDGVNEALEPADVSADALADADHLHLTNQRPETAAHLADLAAEAGCSISFDPGRQAGQRDFGAVLERADVVFVTEREADSLFGGTSVEAMGPDRLVAITAGEGGGTLHAPDATYHHPGFPVSPVDTSGAGDAFAAGFLARWLEGDDAERALEFANACGALASRGRGARSPVERGTVAAFLDGHFGAPDPVAENDRED